MDDERTGTLIAALLGLIIMVVFVNIAVFSQNALKILKPRQDNSKKKTID